MRVARFIIISAVILFSIVTVIGLLFSSKVTVVRQTDIQTNADSAFSYISDIKNWNKWMIDSSVAVAYYTPFTKGKGASAQIGRSRATILSADSGTVTIQWKGERGNPQESGLNIFPSKSLPNGITVQWYFTQHLSWFPWQRIGASLNENILGPSMETDLAKLKKALEE